MTTHHTALAQARSFLFVPGNRPERFDKALASGADAIVLDLEDAVAPEQKAGAREAIAAYLSGPRRSATSVLVRINATETELGRADLDWLETLEACDGLLVPKAENASELEAIAARLPNLGLVPIIESAGGYWNVRALARAAHVVRLAFGHLDFMADTGLRAGAEQSELDPARFAIALASRDAALPPAIDGVTVEIQDDARLGQDVARSIRFGFLGKLCIHPRQVEGVHRALAPNPEEVAWARRVVAADDASLGAAVQLDGRMVDRPVVLRARATLALHARGEGVRA